MNVHATCGVDTLWIVDFQPPFPFLHRHGTSSQVHRSDCSTPKFTSGKLHRTVMLETSGSGWKLGPSPLQLNADAVDSIGRLSLGPSQVQGWPEFTPPHFNPLLSTFLPLGK